MALMERSAGLSVSQVLALSAADSPQRDFLVAGGEGHSYTRIREESDALAASLANLGIEAGDRMAILLPGCQEFVVALFALARLGVVAVPINPRLAESEIRYLLRHSQAVGAVTVERFHGVDYLEVFEELLPRLPELQYLVTVGEEDLWYDDRIFQFEDLVSAGRGRELPEVAIDPGESILAILYTSGTTGKPKGVELTHRNLIHAAAATADGIGLERTDRVFGVTALFHVFGIGPGILGCALTGSTLILQEEFEAEEALDLIAEHRATVHYGVPTVFAEELRVQRRAPRDLSSLRVGLVAGAPMPEELAREVVETLCPELLVAYSLTETASVLALTRAGDPREKRRLTAGRPVRGMEARVLESDGTVLPVESLGEIAARGPQVMKGYYRQPGETARAFDADGFFRTGDLGIVDEEGFVHLVGRRKEVIIRGGYNVYPREVEDRIHAHPAVREAAVVGVKDAVLGEAICAAVIPVEGAIVTDSEIRDWCGEILAEYKVPDRVHFMEAFPMTGTGKIRRVELVRLLESEDTTRE